MEGDEQAECAALALRLAQEAGALIREAFYEAQSPAFELKAENDHVTATDLACEQLILDGLCAAPPFPFTAPCLALLLAAHPCRLEGPEGAEAGQALPLPLSPLRRRGDHRPGAACTPHRRAHLDGRSPRRHHKLRALIPALRGVHRAVRAEGAGGGRGGGPAAAGELCCAAGARPDPERPACAPYLCPSDSRAPT